MVIEALVALSIITITTVSVPVETKASQEIKSVSTTIDANKAVKPKTKPKKKKAAKKVIKKKTIKQQPTQELLKKETVKSEPAKVDPTPTVSSPEQKSNQSNLLYYVLGLLTLGIASAYFYFRKKSQTTDANKFKYTPPNLFETTLESQQLSSSEQTRTGPKLTTEEDGKKS